MWDFCWKIYFSVNKALLFSLLKIKYAGTEVNINPILFNICSPEQVIQIMNVIAIAKIVVIG